jgi:hypothetical protein
VFESQEAGRTLEAFLRNNGFTARNYDDKLFRYFLFLRPPQITYRVQVRKVHFGDACKLLEASPPAVLGQAIHCPTCRSLRINYPQMTRQFVLPTILLHLGIIFRVIDHECYCESCHHMWNLHADAPIRKSRTAKWFPY